VIETNEAVAVVTVGLIALVPAIDTVKRWFGAGDKRQIQQPLIVKPDAEYAPRNHEHPQYMLQKVHDRTFDACDEQRRLMAAQAQNDREAVHNQLKELGKEIRVELAQHNAQAEERASLIHTRINGIAEPVSALKARVEDHIHDQRAHAKGLPK